MDTILIDVTLTCGHIQLGSEIRYEINTWIGNHAEVCEQIAAERMGWV